jgi:hypothetical protein
MKMVVTYNTNNLLIIIIPSHDRNSTYIFIWWRRAEGVNVCGKNLPNGCRFSLYLFNAIWTNFNPFLKHAEGVNVLL